MVSDKFMTDVRDELLGNFYVDPESIDKIMKDPSCKYEVIRGGQLGKDAYFIASQVAERADLRYHGNWDKQREEEGELEDAE